MHHLCFLTNQVIILNISTGTIFIKTSQHCQSDVANFWGLLYIIVFNLGWQMAYIEKRKTQDGDMKYRVLVRLKGHPTQTATFERLTDARNWA